MKVLFYSGSVGLGHVNRDLAIANELRKRRNDLDIVWLAGEPAATALRGKNEKVLIESDTYQNETEEMEAGTDGVKVSMNKYIMSWNKNWRPNFQKFLVIADKVKPDLVIGDEPYEVVSGFNYELGERKWPLVTMYDWVKFYASQNDLVSRIVAWKGNALWVKGLEFKRSADVYLFFGHPDDIPNERYGLFRPNARKGWMGLGMVPVGEPIGFENGSSISPKEEREKLGVRADETLIIGTAGGTSCGKGLLELFARAFPVLKEKNPKVRMMLACGPRIDPKSLNVPEGVEVKGNVPELYRSLAACDVAITHGGGGTTMELVALKKPFVYFPYEGHMEQEVNVGRRLARRKAGVRMTASKTSPQELATVIEGLIGKQVDYDTSYMNGVKGATDEIIKLMDKIGSAG